MTKANGMKDSWKSGNPYDYFMGRWSQVAARPFLNWLAPASSLRWLDVGCGPGALSEAIITAHDPKMVIAVDQSEGFIATAQARLGSRALCKVGNALSLPLDESSVDITVSGLVLNFIPNPGTALAEMRRVTACGGTIAAYVWDYAGRMDFLRFFWDAAVALKPEAANLHESNRFPDTKEDRLRALFEKVQLAHVETIPLEIETRFTNFDDFWKPFLGGQGPAPTFVLSLDKTEQEKLKADLLERLPVHEDGSISMVARAWGVKGSVVDPEKSFSSTM